MEKRTESSSLRVEFYPGWHCVVIAGKKTGSDAVSEGIRGGSLAPTSRENGDPTKDEAENTERKEDEISKTIFSVYVVTGTDETLRSVSTIRGCPSADDLFRLNSENLEMSADGVDDVLKPGTPVYIAKISSNPADHFTNSIIHKVSRVGEQFQACIPSMQKNESLSNDTAVRVDLNNFSSDADNIVPIEIPSDLMPSEKSFAVDSQELSSKSKFSKPDHDVQTSATADGLTRTDMSKERHRLIAFSKAMHKHGKNFRKIAEAMEGFDSSKACIDYYYSKFKLSDLYKKWKVQNKSRERQANSKKQRMRPIAGTLTSVRSVKKTRTLASAPSKEARIKVQQENPKKNGSKSFLRYEGYKSAQTFGEYLKLGGSRADFKFDYGRGYISLLDSDGADITGFVDATCGVTGTRSDLLSQEASISSAPNVSVPPSSKADSFVGLRVKSCAANGKETDGREMCGVVTYVDTESKELKIRYTNGTSEEAKISDVLNGMLCDDLVSRKHNFYGRAMTLVGTVIYKKFDSKFYKGVIRDVDVDVNEKNSKLAVYFDVLYEDGDAEDFEVHDLLNAIRVYREESYTEAMDSFDGLETRLKELFPELQPQRRKRSANKQIVRSNKIKKAKKEKKKKKKKKGKGAPTAYALFMKDNMPMIKSKFPDLQPSERMKEIGKMWREETSEAVKEKYKALAMEKRNQLNALRSAQELPKKEDASASVPVSATVVANPVRLVRPHHPSSMIGSASPVVAIAVPVSAGDSTFPAVPILPPSAVAAHVVVPANHIEKRDDDPSSTDSYSEHATELPAVGKSVKLDRDSSLDLQDNANSRLGIFSNVITATESGSPRLLSAPESAGRGVMYENASPRLLFAQDSAGRIPSGTSLPDALTFTPSLVQTKSNDVGDEAIRLLEKYGS